METRQDYETLLARTRKGLAEEITRLPALRLELRIGIEMHITACHRELGRIEELKITALSGECDMRNLLKAEQKVDECLSSIETCEETIRDTEDALADDELWKD
jgi:hypothetical protein